MRMPSSTDGASGPEPGQFGLAAVSLRGPLRDARYGFIVSVSPCDCLGAESVRDSSWTRNAAPCLPTSQSRFAVEFLSGCRCVLSRRRPPPPESRGRPCPLCGRTTSSLPDAFSALPRRATQRRPLDFGALPACSLPCRLQVLLDVRHLEGGLELLTGLHPPPGAARLELGMQTRSLTSDEHRIRIDENQRELALADAHVDALLQEGRGGGPVMANILQADFQLVCSLTSFLGERPERLSTFSAGSDTNVAQG
jgi:hypothetical protein